MGGDGSGRKPEAGTIVANIQYQVPIMPPDVYLPNLSGVRDDARKDGGLGGTTFLLNSGDTGTGTYNFINTNPAVDLGFDLTGYAESGAAFGVKMKKARGTVDSPSQTLSGDNLGAWLFGGYSNAGAWTGNNATILVYADEDFTATGQGTDIRFGTTPVGSITRQERMRIDNNGNVGIGTASPADNLHVYESTAGLAGVIIADALSSNSMFKMFNSGSERWAMYNNYATDDLYFREDGTDVRMTIQEGGNVGIGTVSPSYLLDVVGAGAQSIRIKSTSNQPSIYLNSPDTGQSHIYFGGVTDPDAGRISYSDNVDDMWFSTNNTEAMRIDNDGNVGIGTTAPATKLQVTSTARTTAYDASNPATWADVSIQNPTDTLNAATGIRFVVDAVDTISAGAGIVAIKRDASSHLYDLAFIADKGTGDFLPFEMMRLTNTGDIQIPNASDTTPTLSLSGSLFCSGGQLWFLGSSGTYTKIANS